jgi:lysylphosphatidylglycerol synthetase-like protein (DUF2156 family)
VKPLAKHQGEHIGAVLAKRGLFRAGPGGQVDLFTLKERVSYLKKYGGNCMSFSLLQQGMHYFDIPNLGFIAYRQMWGIRAVLSDPVCDVKDRETIIAEFLKDGNKTGFVQISQGVARLLHEKFGYYATQFGVEVNVDIETWDLKGKKKQVIRTALNHAKKQGIVIDETLRSDGCRELTDEWLKTRRVKNREIAFLIRPMDMTYQEGTRKFYAYQRDELIGFIYFDPVYSGNRVTGYAANISRFSCTFKTGIFYPLMIHALEVFRKEGVTCMHLGLCPAVVDEKDLPGESIIVKKIIRLLYSCGNSIFSFKGLYFTKTRFGGVENRTFCAHKEMLPIKSFLTLFRLANII